MTRYTPLWLQAGSYPASNDRRLLSALWPGHVRPDSRTEAPVDGFIIAVQAGTMTAYLSPGKAAVPLTNGGTALCVSDANELVTVPPAPGSGLNRWDIVYAQARGNDFDGGPNNDFILAVASGPTFTTTDVLPALPPNSLALWYIKTAGGSAAINPAAVFDQRTGGSLALPGGMVATQVRLTAAISVPGSTQAVILSATGQAGHYYLVNWHMTLSTDAGDPAAPVSGWLNDNLNAVANGSSTSTVPPAGGWATLAGSAIWQCQLGFITTQLTAYCFGPHVNAAANSPVGASGATAMTLLDLGTASPQFLP